MKHHHTLKCDGVSLSNSYCYLCGFGFAEKAVISNKLADFLFLPLSSRFILITECVIFGKRMMPVINKSFTLWHRICFCSLIVSCVFCLPAFEVICRSDFQHKLSVCIYVVPDIKVFFIVHFFLSWGDFSPHFVMFSVCASAQVSIQSYLHRCEKQSDALCS